MNYKPDGYHPVTPYLVVDGAEELIAFITTVLDGKEMMRLPGSDARIGHAEMQVGDSVIMLADTPASSAPTEAMLHLYVPDADATYRRAIEHGAESLREPRDEFYGDRMAGVRDRFGNQWYFATHIRDVGDTEMQQKAAELAG